MPHIYISICLIFSFIHAEILGADYVHKGISGHVSADAGALPCGLSSKSDTHYQEEFNLFDVAQKILDEVLQFDLKTANSVASNCEHNNIFNVMREKSPLPVCYDENGYIVYFLDEIYGRAKKSIEYGVANCFEYAQIGTIFSLEMIYLFANKIDLKYIRGKNFDHEYIAIGRRHENSSQWVVIDPWLRKVFPWDETPAHLKEAGVNPNFGLAYEYNIVRIFDRQGNYHPAKYNLRTIKKLVEDKPKSILLALGNFGYKVPYESQQKYYNPETHEMFIGSKIRVRVRKKNLN